MLVHRAIFDPLITINNDEELVINYVLEQGMLDITYIKKVQMTDAIERVRKITNGWDWMTVYDTKNILSFAQQFLADLKTVSETLITRNDHATKILQTWELEGTKHPKMVLEQLCEVFGIPVTAEG